MSIGARGSLKSGILGNPIIGNIMIRQSFGALNLRKRLITGPKIKEPFTFLKLSSVRLFNPLLSARLGPTTSILLLNLQAIKTKHSSTGSS